MSRRARIGGVAWLLALGLALPACGRKGEAGQGQGSDAKAPVAGELQAGPGAAGAAGQPPADAPGVSDDVGSAVLLPDSEPAGAPFASSIAAAVGEVTQGGAVAQSRIYRIAYEQARRQINADNARDRLRAIERQVDLERQALR